VWRRPRCPQTRFTLLANRAERRQLIVRLRAEDVKGAVDALTPLAGVGIRMASAILAIET
jgi:endonuclease III